jgi:UDP-N-acetyl-D-glucosamine dehydrogenase
MSSETVIIVGQGYVGLPLAMRAVEAGYDVLGYDVDEHRAKALAAGTSFVEDVPDATVADAIATGR